MTPVPRGLRHMTRWGAMVGAVLGVLLGSLLLVATPREAMAQDARAFVGTLGEQAIQVLGPSVSPAQRLARFRELFRNDFDVPGIGQFVLGRYWRTATPQEQQEFLALFQEYIVRAYSARLGEYGGEPFRVTGVRPNADETIVTSEIIRSNSSRVAVDWYLIGGTGQYKITDVYVGGISMKVTQRDEFAAVIQRSGGQVGGLIDPRQFVTVDADQRDTGVRRGDGEGAHRHHALMHRCVGAGDHQPPEGVARKAKFQRRAHAGERSTAWSASTLRAWA